MALRVVALAGGVGGAKLAAGLAQALPPEALTLVVNTGDDFEHLGLSICPDLDTVTYTLAGLANPHTGWGRRDESWNFLETLEVLSGPTWFRLGDRDLAVHVERTRRLRAGWSLSRVTESISRSFGVQHTVRPMSDQPVRTVVLTDEGELAFQEYFVALGCEPPVRGFRFQGVEAARPAPGVIEALAAAEVVVFCPSNPWVSLDPILAVAGIREAVSRKPTLAVSPLVGGKALKGPAAKMYAELGFEPSAQRVAEHYRDLLDVLVIDREDQNLRDSIQALGMETLVTQTIMRTPKERYQLAKEVLGFVQDTSLAEVA